MTELISSIKEKGIIQPILVSRTREGFQLIAGERRWRAAQKAGLDKIPAWVREVSPAETLELALVENTQRKDLNPIEEASAYHEMIQNFNLTQEALAKTLGKDRSTIANSLRLLKLPSILQQDLIDGRLTPGHARVLITLGSPSAQKEIRNLIIKRSLSVRQTEALIKRAMAAKKAKTSSDAATYYLDSLATDLQKSLATKVTIRRRGEKGRIIIEFYSDEDLSRLVDRLR
jgi:ParB family chromosome partitioning protein